jgi:hypothetical protein
MPIRTWIFFMWMWIRMRILVTKLKGIHADPDPQHCQSGCITNPFGSGPWQLLIDHEFEEK